MSGPREADLELFGDCFACDDELPIAFHISSPSEVGIANVLSRAEHVLRMIGNVDEAPSEDREDRIGPGSAVAHLDAKLNIALDLLGTLIAAQNPPPDPQPIRWSRRGICFRHPRAETPGSSGLLRLYLLHWMPMPVELPANVLACTAEGADFRLWLAFPATAHALEAAIERQLFRRHRLLIAVARQLR